MQLIDNANKLHQMTSVLIAGATAALAVTIGNHRFFKDVP